MGTRLRHTVHYRTRPGTTSALGPLREIERQSVSRASRPRLGTFGVSRKVISFTWNRLFYTF